MLKIIVNVNEKQYVKHECASCNCADFDLRYSDIFNSYKENVCETRTNFRVTSLTCIT